MEREPILPARGGAR